MTAIYNLLSEFFYLKLAITFKNLFLSLVVVRLVIFSVAKTWSFFSNDFMFLRESTAMGLYVFKDS